MLNNVPVILTCVFQDTTVPFGSHVLLIGLVDGRYLWNSLHQRWHPLGRLNKDIDYPQFYSYLSCIGV
jgi:acyloxyacyl hydrolase